MLRIILASIALITIVNSTNAQVYLQKNPLAHTYSIVARDTETGEMAVGVQSHWFSVGTAVSWGESGVGVVATQSFTNKSFGLRGLKLLKEGKTAQEALDILLSSDEGEAFRQVAILDNKGNVATHTGSKNIKFAGHRQGDNFSVQANMMLTDKVWPAMALAYEKNKDLPLAERVIATLKAAQDAGGDIRGKQSAALLVVKGQPVENEWEDPLIDLRVDDNPAPLQDLERLLKVYRAYQHMNNGDLAVEKNDMAAAMKEYSTAEGMFPDNFEMKYWKAVTLANNGDYKTAKSIFKIVFDHDQNWKELTKRLPEVGLLNVDKTFYDEILKL